eukprot:1158476-Pelagomonas_calceolata.AAC.3
MSDCSLALPCAGTTPGGSTPPVSIEEQQLLLRFFESKVGAVDALGGANGALIHPNPFQSEKVKAQREICSSRDHNSRRSRTCHSARGMTHCMLYSAEMEREGEGSIALPACDVSLAQFQSKHTRAHTVREAIAETTAHADLGPATRPKLHSKCFTVPVVLPLSFSDQPLFHQVRAAGGNQHHVCDVLVLIVTSSLSKVVSCIGGLHQWYLCSTHMVSIASYMVNESQGGVSSTCNWMECCAPFGRRLEPYVLSSSCPEK